MNKERYNQTIEEAYKNYLNRKSNFWDYLEEGAPDLDGFRHLTQEEFINKIKTDNEFSKRWGS